MRYLYTPYPDELRVGLTQISSQLPVSDLGEWRPICHFLRWQKMWSVTFVTFLGRMWRSRTRKYLFELVTFFVTSFPKNVTFWPRRYETFLNRKKCDDSAGTETCFSLPVSDLSLISEAWSGKAIWAKTDPKNGQNGYGIRNSPQLKTSIQGNTQHMRWRRQRKRRYTQKTRACMSRTSTTHVRAGTWYLPKQTGWQMRKPGQGTRRQVQSMRTPEGHAVQAPGQGTRRVAVCVPWHNWPPEKCDPPPLNGGPWPRRSPILRAPGCRSCRLVPSWSNYACWKWSGMARTGAPKWAARCPSTMPRGTAIRFRACISRRCQRPGQLLAPSLPSSHHSDYVNIRKLH